MAVSEVLGVRAADVLPSASLLLATASVLLGLWYPDVKTAVNVTVPTHVEDAATQRAIVSDARVWKLRPLLGAYLFLAVVYLPVLAAEAVRSYRNIAHRGLRAIADYDPSAVALCGVISVAVLVLIALIRRRSELLKLSRTLEVSHE